MIKAVLRLCRCAIHLLWGLPRLALVKRVDPARSLGYASTLARRLLAALDVTVTHESAAGDHGPEERALLIVGNHTSWLDVLAVGAIYPCGFVAKKGLADWPIVGSIIAAWGVFADRSNPHSVGRAIADATACLREGRLMCVFPEGTTTDGSRLLPLSPSFFEAAVAAGTAVRVLGITHRERHTGDRDVAVWSDTSFFTSLWRVLSSRGLDTLVAELGVIKGESRFELARRAETLLASHLGVAFPTGGGIAAGSGSGPELAGLAAVTILTEVLADYKGTSAENFCAHDTLVSLGLDSLDIIPLLLGFEARCGVGSIELDLDLHSGMSLHELAEALQRLVAMRAEV